MDSNVRFFSFRQGTLMLTPNDIAKAMYKEALVPNQYDYTDPATGLFFQLISPTKLFVADPSYPVVKLLLTDRWQILYDANFNGPSKLKFVAMGQDVTVANNWKTLNVVLFHRSFSGPLPVKVAEQVYMSVVPKDDSMYIVGTLFTPSQPYLRLTYNGTPAQSIASNAIASLNADGRDNRGIDVLSP